MSAVAHMASARPIKSHAQRCASRFTRQRARHAIAQKTMMALYSQSLKKVWSALPPSPNWACRAYAPSATPNAVRPRLAAAESIPAFTVVVSAAQAPPLAAGSGEQLDHRPGDPHPWGLAPPGPPPPQPPP